MPDRVIGSAAPRASRPRLQRLRSRTYSSKKAPATSSSIPCCANGLLAVPSDMSLLDRLGLNRPELRAWAMYDWANSAFQSTVITAVFPPFFSSFAAAGLPPAIATARFAWTTTIAVTITAILGPILGAIADYRAIKKRMLAVFVGIGVVITIMMGTIGRGEWQYAALLFMISNIAIACSLVFYYSLLPLIAATV